MTIPSRKIRLLEVANDKKRIGKRKRTVTGIMEYDDARMYTCRSEECSHKSINFHGGAPGTLGLEGDKIRKLLIRNAKARCS